MRLCYGQAAMKLNTQPQPANAPPHLLNYDATQHYLGNVSRSTVKTLAGNGEITRICIGSRTMFLRSSLDAYIARIAESALAK